MISGFTNKDIYVKPKIKNINKYPSKRISKYTSILDKRSMNTSLEEEISKIENLDIIF